MTNRVAVIDYGMGNLHSISKALQVVASADASVVVTRDAEQIAQADRVVLPGVGAIRDTMAELASLDLLEPIAQALDSKPFLGICLGMQALLDFSEENGGVECMGQVPGRVKAFIDQPSTEGLSIPHMGWNQVRQARRHALWSGVEDGARFYFVHSYFVDPADASVSVGLSDYGLRFCSVLARDNLFACQFHPEKSQHSGLRLLSNFLSWSP